MVKRRFIKSIAVVTMVAVASMGVFGCGKKVEENPMSRVTIEQSAENTDGQKMEEKVAKTEIRKQIEESIQETTKASKNTEETWDLHETEKMDSSAANGLAKLVEREKLQEESAKQAALSGGCDENGHPYIKEGESYTFGADGYPIQAATKDLTKVTNPNNGEVYCYNAETSEWERRKNAAEKQIIKEIAEGKRQANGEAGARKATEEERREIAEAIARSFQ